MKRIINLVLLFVFSYNCFSQVVKIKDVETEKPINQVMLKESNHKITTNSLGEANISSYKDASKIEITAPGYTKKIISYKDLESLNFELYLNKSIFNMDEVIVSATRWEQYSNDVPYCIATLNSYDIAAQSVQTAADLLGSSNKVFVQKSQLGGGSPMIRGFATNRLLYTVDGVRMNTAIFRGGNIQNVLSLDPFSIDRAEVLFGAGSVIYGSDAIGGVMTFQTLSPQLSMNENTLVSGAAQMRYSSANNENTGHFDVNLGGDKWASVTSISYNNFSDLRMGSYGPDEYLRKSYVQRIDNKDVAVTNFNPLIQSPTGYSQYNIMQKIRFVPNKFLDFQYGFHYSETSDYARYDRHLRTKVVTDSTGRKVYPFYGDWYYGPQKWMMNNLNIENDYSNLLFSRMTIRLAHQLFEESRHDRKFNNSTLTNQTEKVSAYSANIDFNKVISEKDDLYYGIEAIYNDVESEGIEKDILKETEKKAAARYPKSNWSSYAAYLLEKHKFSSITSVEAGLRFNHYRIDAVFDSSFYHLPFSSTKINNNALTGNIAGIFRVSKDFVVKTNLSTAFRSPNIDDIGKIFDSKTGYVTVPNPDLKAEYSYNCDIEVSKQFSDIVRIDLSGYYTYLKDALVRRNFKLNGQDSISYKGEMCQVQAIQNAANANVYGVQAGIEVKMPAGFSLVSNLNYQHGTEELDDGSTSPLRHAPPLFGTSKLVFSSDKVKLQLYANYNAELKFSDMPEDEKSKKEIYAIDADGNPYCPSWWTLNIKAEYKISNNLSVYAGLENIADKRYRPYSSGISAPGRNFIISLKTIF